MEKVKELHPPRGLAKIGFRLPIRFFELGLGGLFGSRFLMLTHTGRKSRLARQVVLEVVRHDKKANEFVVAAGFGTRSDWYQNIRETPNVTVQCGNKKWKMKALFLTPEAAANELVDYAHRHPLAMRELARFMGFKIDESDEHVRAIGKMISLVAFRQEGE